MRGISKGASGAVKEVKAREGEWGGEALSVYSVNTPELIFPPFLLLHPNPSPPHLWSFHTVRFPNSRCKMERKGTNVGDNSAKSVHKSSLSPSAPLVCDQWNHSGEKVCSVLWSWGLQCDLWFIAVTEKLSLYIITDATRGNASDHRWGSVEPATAARRSNSSHLSPWTNSDWTCALMSSNSSQRWNSLQPSTSNQCDSWRLNRIFRSPTFGLISQASITVCSKTPPFTLEQKCLLFQLKHFFGERHLKNTAESCCTYLFCFYVWLFFLSRCRLHFFSLASQPHSQIRCAVNQSTCTVKSVSMSCFTNQ